MDNQKVKIYKIQKKAIAKRLYAAICMLLVSSLLVSTATYAWLTLSMAPEVTNVNTTLEANGSLEIALNTKGIDQFAFVPDESENLDVNSQWGNVVDLSDERYGLQDIEIKPVILNYADGNDFAVDKESPFSIAQYGYDGRIMNLKSLSTFTNYNSESHEFVSSTNYGVRALEEDREFVDSNGTTYAFCLDLLFRTNATASNLLLQTIGIDRIYNNNNAPEGWMYSEEWEAAQGQGSKITMANSELLEAIRVAFTDTITGELYGIAKANVNGDLYLDNENGSTIIRPLEKNAIATVTAWIYLDGNIIENFHADTAAATEMKVNLQFGTDAILYPAYGDDNLSVGKTYIFGSYEQDNNLSNGAEPIEWRVLERQDNNVLLISSLALDAMAYNMNTEAVTWETSSIRSWLNSTFVNSAFTKEEQEAILTTHLANDGASMNYGTPEGNSTDDKIFFLSEEEVLSYFVNDEDRIATATAYAVANGAVTEDIKGVENITCWWTRTPGAEVNTVTLVCSDGAVSGGIYLRSANNDSISIRPAMWITLDEQSDIIPDAPVVPEIPTNAEYYLNVEGGNNYTIYSLANNGTRDYELKFKGTLNESNKAVTLNYVSSYPETGVIIPALATLTDSEDEYAVRINPSQAPFADLGVENATVCFVPVENKKVSVTSTVLSDLFDHNEGTEFGYLDLSGLDTSIATNMSEMFYSCQELTYLNLDGLETSNVTNMNSMFSNCQRIRDIDVSGFDTSKVTDMSKMFLACYSLTSLDLSSWNTIQVTDMSGMFSSCKELVTLDVSGLKTNNVTTMQQMFTLCQSLISVDVSGFDTSKCKNMYYLFTSCSSLQYVDVSNFDTSKVTIMSGMFSGCSSLTELDVSNFDTSNVTSMINMFWGCRALEELDVSGFVTSKCTNFLGMFGNCIGVKVLDVSGFVTSQANGMSSMFENCSSLRTLDLSNFDLSKAYESSEQQTYINDFLIGCTGLESIVTPKNMGTRIAYLSETFTDLSTGLNYMQLDASTPTQTTLTKVAEVIAGTFGDGLTYRLDVSGEMVISGAGRMPDYSAQAEQPWYDYRNKIKTVLIKDGITYIGEGNFFSTSIAEVTIPRSVEEIGNGAFLWCSQLKNVNYGGSAKEWEALAIRQNNEFLLSATVNCALASVPAFNGSGKLDNGLSWSIDSYGAILTISGSGVMPVWEKPTDAPWHKFSDVIQGVIVCDGVTNVSRSAFYGYEKLKSVVLKSGVTVIEDFAFSDCEKLNYIAMPDTLNTINSYAFYGCSNLTDIVIPDSVSIIKDSAFSGCCNLEEFTIPDGIVTIEEGTFLSCSKLESVTIPSSVTSIQDYAFYGCDNLKNIYFKGTEEQWEAISINNSHYEFPSSLSIYFNIE